MTDRNHAFDPLPGDASAKRFGPDRRRVTVTWEPILPVPEDAPKPPEAHYRHGRPSAVWDYHGPDGRLWGRVARFDLAGGEKQVLPLTFCRHPERNAPEWRWKGLLTPRPLYNLHDLITRPEATVIIVEGEKAADAATRLLPGHVAVTSPGGSKAARRADWGPLKGRHAIIWPDADKPGAGYAADVARALMSVGAASVRVAPPPEQAVDGWDAADAEAEGWDTARTMELLNAAAAASEAFPGLHVSGARMDRGSHGSGDCSGGGRLNSSGRRRTSPQRDSLISLVNECELWHSLDGDAYATISVKSHRENWPLRSREFKRWLSGCYYAKHGGAVGGQAMEDGLRVLEAIAANEGPCYEPKRRVGELDGVAYLDLTDANWQAVEITAANWRVIDNPPVKFLRTPHMRPLPAPEAGGMIEELRGFVNVASDGDFMLLVAWMVGALRSRGPYPILMLHGEQGAAKSTASRLLRSLVDPNAAPIRSTPRDERDLVVAARNSWVQAFDNMSAVPNWLSDAFCRLATGGGFSTRALHTDGDEFIFNGQRPIILNGIPDLTGRPDLGSRALPVELPVIPDDTRRPEGELLKEFEETRPRILGALLDSVSAGLQHWPKTRLDRAPRMADFAKWITAAEPGLGWETGAFLEVYEANRKGVVDASFDSNPVAQAIKEYILRHHPEGWDGRPSKLWNELSSFVSERIRNSRAWPQAPNAFGTALRRVAPLLRGIGFRVELGHSGNRFVRIIPPPGWPIGS